MEPHSYLHTFLIPSLCSSSSVSRSLPTSYYAAALANISDDSCQFYLITLGCNCWLCDLFYFASSNVNEVIRAISNLFIIIIIFLQKDLTRTKKHKNHKKHKKYKKHKKHKKQKMRKKLKKHKNATGQKHKKYRKYQNPNEFLST